MGTAAIAGSDLIVSQLEAVHTRHHEIEDGQLIRRSVGGGGPQELQSPRSRIGCFMNHSPRVQLV